MLKLKSALYFLLLVSTASWAASPSKEVKMKVKVTYIGTATLLLEIGDQSPVRILTDPAFDPAGKHYKFKLGTGSTKTLSPALTVSDLPHIDAVLLSHDEHADNLDIEGRKFLPLADQVLTTPSGAKRLVKLLGSKVKGLENWQTVVVTSPGGLAVTVTAVPARHGQRPLPVKIVGDTVGFILEWPGQAKGPVYISGDTVFFEGMQQIADRFKVGTAILHLGGVKFGISGPLRYTFNGHDAVETIRVLKPQTIIPIHYDGWTHFHETLEQSEREIAKAKLEGKVVHLPRGTPVELDF